MHALNIRKKDTKEQIKLVFDCYRNSVENVIDNNIDNEIFGKNNLLQLTKLKPPAFSLKKAIPLLSRLFNNNTKAISSKSNNFSTFLLSNLSPILLSSIMPNDLLNSLLKSNDYKL